MLPSTTQHLPGAAARSSDECPGEGMNTTLRRSLYFKANKQQYPLRVPHASPTHTAFPSQGLVLKGAGPKQLFIRRHEVVVGTGRPQQKQSSPSGGSPILWGENHFKSENHFKNSLDSHLISV